MKQYQSLTSIIRLQSLESLGQLITVQDDEMLSEYDRIDLIKKAGALHLIPENSDFFAEVTRISAIAASLGENGAPLFNISDHEWKQWINSDEPMSEAAEYGGDPVESLFVAEFVIDGGAFLALPVCRANDHYSLQTLLRAVLRSERFRDTQFRKEASQIAATGLLASDIALRRAGLSRFTQPTDSENGDLRWPDRSRARELENAVAIDLADFDHKLQEMGYGQNQLDRLSVRAGACTLSYGFYSDNPMWKTPIVMTDGELILAAASTIVPAIRLAILECASQHGLNDAVRDAYGEVVRYDVVRSALTMDWAPVEPKEDVDAESTIVFQFDVDKVAFVYLDSVWDPEGIAGTALQDRINANDASEEWRGFQALHLVVIEFVVDACFQLPQSAVPSSTVVSISSDELVIFSGLNQSDQIALWKVARSIHSEERQLRSIMGEGFLDSYSIYDTNKKSFYVSDEGRPDAIWAMATGVLCRRKHLARCDRHFAPCRASRTWRGGTKLHSRPNEPIYVAEDSSPANVHLLAEVGRCYIWVASRSEVGCRLPPVLLGEFLAFWAWQMIPDVAANSSSEFNMRIDAVVTRESQMCPVCGDSVSSFHFCFRPDRVNFFTSEDWLSRLLETVDNTGERQILVELLPAILSALKHEIDVDAVHEIVDRCAPVGNKRKLVTVRGGDAQIISLEGLPRIRTIDDFDLGVNADAIGSHAQANWSDKTTEAYNAIVEFLFHQFRDVVDNWSSDHCLETLMLQHERLVAERKQLETQIPCTIACYGADEDHVLHLRNMLGDIDRASIASRFLIEYTAAVPPSGGAELSLSGYDRALALALDIATYGMQSDSVQYGVSTRSLRILGSGRLSQLDEHYDNVAAKFSHSTFRSKFLLIQKADLPSIEEESRDDPKMFDKLEAATRQEYGIELTNLLRLFGFIANSPFTQESGFGNARTAELIGYLSTELNMPEDQLHSVLARITLRRRKSFLRPPSPFRAVDVYPWRFNRELSYLRRPLIVHEHNGEPMLCWGMRAVVQAASYWVTLCTEGRMKNLSTNAMKSLQGEIANARGHAFNRHVANLVRQREGISSRANVTRLKSKRVEDIDGHDLGDIDVLAVQLRSRKVYVIEVKSFSAAKTPVEMANERDKLFGEESEENGAVRKHLRRVQWIRDNLDTVIDDMAGDQLEASIWTVVPVIVIDEDLFMSHLIADAIQVVTLEAFLRILDRNTGH